jgi:dUTP pyrophosphatase
VKVKIKRFDKSIPLPTYQTEGSVCMDLYSRKKVTIKSKKVGYIPLNIALDIPKGHWVMVAARTSTHKFGVMPVHGIGIGDEDFKGNEDEYVFPVYNFTESKVKIEKGTRIAQLMIIKFEKIELEEIDKFDNSNRGKFGSTGYK